MWNAGKATGLRHKFQRQSNSAIRRPNEVLDLILGSVGLPA
jgi:hypothetical protein